MVSGIDPRNEARHRRAVIERSRLTLLGFVMPADWRERRALRRMTARGEAFLRDRAAGRVDRYLPREVGLGCMTPSGSAH
jgi:hypothetical protein